MLLHYVNQEHPIRSCAPWVATTNKHDVATHTVPLQLPVAVHLSLSLNPVAAVCPEGGLGLSNDSSAWERRDSSCVTETPVVPVSYERAFDLKEC